MDYNDRIDYYNNSDTFNSSNITSDQEEVIRNAYKYFVPPLFIFCILSLFINIRVLLAVHWVRRPLSPTLHISLSLAAADACTSALLCTGLLINSYLPVVYKINAPCFLVYCIEIYRLSGIIITVIHLLALSINHWLGILKPLHYTTMMTTRKMCIITIILWLTPIIFFKVYFFINIDYSTWLKSEKDCKLEFLGESKFRIIFFLLLVIPLILMIFCYGHILHIVRKQQRIWANLSRSGSQRIRGHTRQSTQQRRTMEGNVKAVHTTLLILGSCMIGWMPASLIYVLICDEGCVFHGASLAWDVKWIFFLSWSTNVLIILKTLVNPIIYSARMMEIKDGMRRMQLAASRVFCNNNRREMYMSNLQPLQLGYSGSVNAVGVTALCKLNGSITTKRSIRSNYPNTLV